MRNDFSKAGSKSPNLSNHSNFIPATSLPTFKCATGQQRKSQLIRNYNVKELICQSAAAADKEPHGAATKHCLESINYEAINLSGDLDDDLLPVCKLHPDIEVKAVSSDSFSSIMQLLSSSTLKVKQRP